MPELQPLGRMMRVRPLPASPRSTILHTPDPETTLKWVVIEAVGPLVKQLPTGCEALVSFNQAQNVGDDLALLPEGAVLLIRAAGAV